MRGASHLVCAVRRPIGRSPAESLRSATTVSRIALSHPVACAVGRTIGRCTTISVDRCACIDACIRGRRTIVGQLTLTLGYCRRIAACAVATVERSRAIVCRWSITCTVAAAKSARTIRRRVCGSITAASGNQTSRVHRQHRSVRSRRCRRRTRHDRAIHHGGGRSGYASPRIRRSGETGFGRRKRCAVGHSRASERSVRYAHGAAIDRLAVNKRVP
jgi:hypothetical protein